MSALGLRTPPRAPRGPAIPLAAAIPMAPLAHLPLGGMIISPIGVLVT